MDDGDIVYNIVTAAATSVDSNYNSLDAADVVVTNSDDDAAGFTLGTISGATTEAGGTATFTLVLNSEPTANVVIALSSDNPSEGTVLPASLTFTTGNWNVNQTVTVTGVNDVADGNIDYNIVTAAATSDDDNYSGLNAADVSVTNSDNDVNDTFDNSLDGWGYSGPSGYSLSNDNSMAHISGDGVGVSVNPGAEKTFDVSNNDSVTLSFDWRASSGCTCSITTNFSLMIPDTSGNILSSQQLQGGGTTDTGIQSYSADITSIISGHDSIVIRMWLNDSWTYNWSQNIWWDNVGLLVTTSQ